MNEKVFKLRAKILIIPKSDGQFCVLNIIDRTQEM